MARRLAERLDTEIVVDTMEGTLQSAYNPWPIRLYVLVGGTVRYAGDQGPFGYVPAELDAVLEDLTA